jgi:hypothetical protein
MNPRETDVKVIIDEFSIWQYKLASHNALNLQDLNLISEYDICQILNLIYDYSLENSNLKHSNQPAIDLADRNNRIAFQVTTDKSVKKVQQTLNKFDLYQLDQQYDQLYIMILGDRQKRYPSLKIPEGISFDPKEQIIDFKTLIKTAHHLPSNKLSRLKEILTGANPKTDRTERAKAVQRQKKMLAMKKKFLKNFLDHEEIKENFEKRYSPKTTPFIAGSAIIRQTGDQSFPGLDPNQPKWTIKEFHNLYEYGVEFIGGGCEVIVDKKGFWDLLRSVDGRNNASYKKIVVHPFYRLAYHDIDDFDTQTDGYHGYPTIYCDFRHDNWPFEKVLFGRLGNDRELSAAYYLDEAMRTVLP